MSMDFSDMVAEVKEEAKRRIASPLFGAYALSWCSFNYQLLIVLFSAGDYEKKIKYITSDLYAQFNGWAVFGWPLLASLLYVTLSPVASVAIDLWAKWIGVQGDNLYMLAETKRWGSDDALRTLARNKGYEADSLRRRATESVIAVGALTFKRMSTPGDESDAARPRLTGLANLPSSVSADVLEVIEQAGIPREAYGMLKMLSDHGIQTEEQLIRHGGNQAGDTADSALAFLLGAKLIELIWKDGPLPRYKGTDHGQELTQVITERYAHRFG
jgi:hypothetical protein